MMKLQILAASSNVLEVTLGRITVLSSSVPLWLLGLLVILKKVLRFEKRKKEEIVFTYYVSGIGFS